MSNFRLQLSTKLKLLNRLITLNTSIMFNKHNPLSNTEHQPNTPKQHLLQFPKLPSVLSKFLNKFNT